MGLQVQHASLCMWAFLVAGGWHGCAGWLLASIALLKTPNCVAQLQKQFSSFASEKDKAALDRGWAGVQWLWQWVTLIRCSTGRTTPVQMAWQKQSWTAASGGALGNRGHGGRGWGRCLPGKALRSQTRGRRPDLGSGSPVSWAGVRPETGRSHVVRWA